MRPVFILYVFIFMLVQQLPGFAQRFDNGNIKSRGSLTVGYNDVNSGQNLSLVYTRNVKHNWRFYCGIKYFLPNAYTKNSPANYTTFYKEFYVKDFVNHFGLKLGFEKKLAVLSAYSTLYGFYDFQFTAANIDNLYYNWGNGNNNPYIEQHDLAINAFENTVGLGTSVRLSPVLDMNIQAGLGLSLFSWRKNYYNNASLGSEGTLNRMLALSLSYHLDGRQVSRKAGRQQACIEQATKHSIAIDYDNLQTGRNINLTYHRYFADRFSVYGGIKFNMNSHSYYDFTRMSESYYFKQFRASGLQHFGIKAGAAYAYPVCGSNVRLFAFYDFQVMKCDVRNLVGLTEFMSGLSRTTSNGVNENLIVPGSKFIGSTYPPQKSFRTYGPVLAVEQYMGLGAKVRLGHRTDFKVQAGIGYNFYSGPDTYQPYVIQRWQVVDYYNNVAWGAKRSEVSRIFSFGLEYSLGRK